MAGITPKQEAFCIAFLKTNNATEAYLSVYNCKPGVSAQAKWNRASEVMRHKNVVARIAELKAERSIRTNIDIDWVLVEAAWLYNQAKAVLAAELSPKAITAAKGALETVGKHVNIQAFKDTSDVNLKVGWDAVVKEAMNRDG